MSAAAATARECRRATSPCKGSICSRNWVFAIDFLYQRDASTRLTGTTGAAERIDEDFGSAWRFGLAPAIEYNFTSRVGVIAGARWFADGRNTSATVTPVVAVNMVY